jgi:heptosyltransferase-2
VLAVGAAHKGKAIPESNWAAILKGLLDSGHAVSLIGGPAEAVLSQRLMASHAESVGAAGPQLQDECGASWSRTFSVMAGADLLIAGDTGAMHAGSALGIPMVVVWGCTSPALGMGPWKAHPDTVQLHPVSPERSRPCSRLGDRCRHRVPCIQRVSAERILAAALGLLNQTAP